MGSITVSWDEDSISDEEDYQAVCAGGEVSAENAAEVLKNSVVVAILQHRANIAAMEAKQEILETQQDLAGSFSADGVDA